MKSPQIHNHEWIFECWLADTMYGMKEDGYEGDNYRLARYVCDKCGITKDENIRV